MDQQACKKRPSSSLTYRSKVLGKAVLRAAAGLGIEPARLAEVLGISTSSISRLSRGAYSLKRSKERTFRSAA